MNDVPEIASKSHLDNMINNRDYSALINYSPPIRCLNAEHSAQVFSHDLRLLEIRSVLLSCIYYSACLVKEFSLQDIKPISSELNGINSDEPVKSENLKQLDLHLEKLKNLHNQLENDPSVPIPKNVFGSFFGSKLHGLEKSKITITIVIHFIELIRTLGVNVNKSASMDDEWMNKMKTSVAELTSGFEKAISLSQSIVSKTINEVDSNMKLEGRKEVLEILTNMVDVSIFTTD